MSTYSLLQRAAQNVADVKPAIESVELCANFIRRNRSNPGEFPRRESELVDQLLESIERLSRVCKTAEF